MQGQDREFNKFMVQRFMSVCKIVELACDAAPVERGTKVPKNYIKVPYTLHKYSWTGGMTAAFRGDGHLKNLEEQWAGINSDRGQREIIRHRDYGHQRCGYVGIGAINFRHGCDDKRASSPIRAETFIHYARMTK